MRESRTHGSARAPRRAAAVGAAVLAALVPAGAAADLLPPAPPPSTQTVTASVGGAAVATVSGTVSTVEQTATASTTSGAPAPAAATAATAAPTASTAAAAVGTSSAVRRLLAAVDGLRADRGLAALSLSAGLAAAAAAHAASMARRGYFSHASADGTPFWKRLERYYPVGGHSRCRVGETLWWSALTTDARAAAAAWLASGEHRRVLLGGWHEVGLAVVHAAHAPGVYSGQDVTIVVADFGVCLG